MSNVISNLLVIVLIVQRRAYKQKENKPVTQLVFDSEKTFFLLSKQESF